MSGPETPEVWRLVVRFRTERPIGRRLARRFWNAGGTRSFGEVGAVDGHTYAWDVYAERGRNGDRHAMPYVLLGELAFNAFTLATAHDVGWFRVVELVAQAPEVYRGD